MNREKIYSISLVSAALILFSILFLSSVSAVPEQNASSIVTETQITTNNSSQQNPTIYGNWIVWEDSRNGNLDIYMYDLFTSREAQITSNESDQWGPDIYGDKIVWLDKRNSESVPDSSFGGFDVYMYSLSTKEETRVSKSTVPINPDALLKVDIDADEIVWGSGGDGISAYNISTGKQSDISSNVSLYNIAFSGNKIAGTDDMDGREGIVYVYDLSTFNLTQITANESAYGGPGIFGNRIVWPDSRNGNNSSGFDLYMYDLSSKNETQITTNNSVAWSVPRIYGDRIVWVDDRNVTWDIYMYDLANKNETRISTSGSAYQPSIYNDSIGGSGIVWADNRYGNSDIYLATIPDSNSLYPSNLSQT